MPTQGQEQQAPVEDSSAEVLEAPLAASEPRGYVPLAQGFRRLAYQSMLFF